MKYSCPIIIFILFSFLLTGCRVSKVEGQKPYGVWQSKDNSNYTIILDIDPAVSNTDFVGTYNNKTEEYDLTFSIHQGFNNDAGRIGDIKIKSATNQSFHEIESLYSWAITSIPENRMVVIVDKLSRDVLKTNKIVFTKIQSYSLDSSAIEMAWADKNRFVKRVSL